MTIPDQPTPQAARVAARRRFAESVARGQLDGQQDAAEHDAAIEQFIDQLHPGRRVPRW